MPVYKDTLQQYSLILGIYAAKYGLDSKILNKVLKMQNQNPMADITPSQQFILDVIKTMKECNTSAIVAIALLQKDAQESGKTLPNFDQKDVWARSETYYMKTHKDELRSPFGRRVIDIFNTEYERTHGKHPGFDMRKYETPHSCILIRVTAAALKEKNLDTDMISDEEICQTIKENTAQILAEANIGSVEILSPEEFEERKAQLLASQPELKEKLQELSQNQEEGA